MKLSNYESVVFGAGICIATWVLTIASSFGPYTSEMGGKILTDSSGVVYRLERYGIWKDSRYVFYKQNILKINDSTYEQTWTVVKDD